LALKLPSAERESQGMIALMLALQEATANAPPPAMLAIDFDLARPPAASPSPQDIVVTARRENRSQRLPPLPDVREDLLPQAQTGLFGGTAAIVTEAHGLPGGVTSNRIMLNWKMKF
jgi:hypothetical protein